MSLSECCNVSVLCPVQHICRIVPWHIDWSSTQDVWHTHQQTYQWLGHLLLDDRYAHMHAHAHTHTHTHMHTYTYVYLIHTHAFTYRQSTHLISANLQWQSTRENEIVVCETYNIMCAACGACACMKEAPGKQSQIEKQIMVCETWSDLIFT